MAGWSRRRLAFALALALLCAPAAAAKLEPSGYFKDVFVYSHSPADGRPYGTNTTRARLTLDAEASVLRGHVDYDHEVIAGSYFRTVENRLIGLGEPQEWLPMEQTISTSATSLWRHRLYRGWVGVENERALLRFGRQRIAWGTGKIWNPTDVFNPYQPTSVERDQRRGVDSAYARVSLGALSQAEVAWAPRDRWPQHALLARLRGNAAGWDASLLGGKAALSTHSWLVGGDFAGNLLDGTLHGEWSYTHAEIRQAFFKGDLGFDYTISADAPPGLRETSVVVEYLFNGAGERDPKRYRLGDVLSGREVTLARHYAGVTVAKDLHPLLKLEIVWLTNLDDKSQFANPSLQYNALENFFVTVGLQRFGGPRRTEFGRPANIFNAQAQYFF